MSEQENDGSAILYGMYVVCTVLAWIVGGTIGGLVGAAVVWIIHRAF